MSEYLTEKELADIPRHQATVLHLAIEDGRHQFSDLSLEKAEILLRYFPEHIDRESPASAADWLRTAPEDRHPEGGFEPFEFPEAS